MRIGVVALGSQADRVIAQAQRAEEDGFSSLWFTGAVPGDPFIPMTLAARATSSIEVGTAVQQSYAAHPLLQAARALSAAEAIGVPGRFTLGVGPSHRPAIEGRLGLSYDTPGRHTDEYVQILTALLRGEHVSFAGQEFTVNAGPSRCRRDSRSRCWSPPSGRACCGWPASTRPARSRGWPTPRRSRPTSLRSSARPPPRPGAPPLASWPAFPVAVHDDVDEARAAAAEQFATYGQLPNYQRILAHGGLSGPAEAVIVGDEASVTRQIKGLFEAGATDLWLPPFPVGPDRSASRARTRALLKELARS